jgi:hypothetical protein
MQFSRLAFTVAMAALCAPAGAVTNVTVQLGIAPNFSGGTGPVNTVVTQSAPAELSSGLVTGGFSATGTGHAYADIGTLKVDGTSTGSLNSVVRSIFRDDFRVDLPGVAAGTQVEIDFKMNVSGTLGVTDHNIATAGWQVAADMGGGFYDLGASGHLYNNSSIFAQHGYVGDAMGLLTGTAVVPTGQWLPMSVELTASAQTSYEGGADTTSGEASFDLSHSLTWAGMTVSLAGVAQPGATVQSGSGFNYLQPVPEPSTGLLIGLGASFLAWRRRAH